MYIISSFQKCMTATLEAVGDEELVDFCREVTSIPNLDSTSCAADRPKLEGLYRRYVCTMIEDDRVDIIDEVRKLLGAVPGF
jgi:hypothetical protein